MRNRIWIPELPPIKEVETAQFVDPVMTFKVGGEFIVELIDAKSGRVKERYQFPNLITDAGMDAIGTRAVYYQNLFAYLGVGTDGTAPNVADTTLGAELNRTNSDGGFTDNAYGYVTGSTALDAPYQYKEKVRVFVEGEANGNLAELGWFQSAAAGTMVVRSLFKDGTGTPITVTKTSADQLKVTYRYRIYPPVTITTGSFILTKTATTHSFTASAINITNTGIWGGLTNGMLNTILTEYRSFTCPSASGIVSPTGSANDFYLAGNYNTPDSNTIAAYTGGTFYLDMETIFGASLANYGPGGIPGFVVSTSGFFTNMNWQVYVTPPIIKTNLDELKMNWRATWDRAVLT